MAERAAIKRSTVIEHIKQIHAMAMSVRDDASLASTLSVLVTDLDSLWTQFKMEDDSHLDCLLLLGKSDQYLYSLSSETRRLIGEAKAVAASFIPTGAEAIDLSYINQRVPSSQDSDVIVKNSPRLPEIPLPKFSGEFREWPAFRDKFSALVNSRSDLSNFEKIYYLMGCLEGAAAEAVQSIPVAGDNYTLVWSTLSERFNRPRLVATSLVEQLLHTPPMTHESLHDLNSFLCTFHENFSLINALKLPDLGSFILFTMAFRCLPVHTRKTFEASNTAEYPSITQLLEFVRSRVAILEVVGDTKKSSVLAASKDGKSTGQSVKGGDPLGKRSSSRAMSFVTAKTDVKCPCCSEQHKLTSCIKFKSWTNEDRVRWTRENRLCFICFGADHWVPRCKSKPNCNKCTQRHHFLLHSSEDESRDKDETPPANVSNVSMCAAVRRSPKPAATSVLLGTALVHVRDRSGSWHTLRALVDCASQISAITDVCVTRLGLKRSRWTAPISGLSGTSVVNVLGRVDCVVQPRFSSEPALSVRAWILPTITGDLPKQSLSSGIKDRYSNLALADPHFDVSSPVDLLLGGDVYASIMDGRKVSIDNALPSAFSSIFGWILIGPVSDSETRAYQSLPVCMTLSLECLMDKFWQVEEPAMVPSTFTDNGQCEKLFSEQMGRLPSGRFSVPLPFRSQVSSETFVGSREVAARRFEMLERKLSSNPKLKSLYDKFMSDYISLGHMSLAQSPGHYFIPHHAIFRPEIDDSKIRVVFDASARGFRGPSLNQCLFPGPKLHQDIIDILIRFRVSKHVFTTDICKMYRQILVKPEHRKFQHVLWRASPHDAVREYELHTVTYGVNCAPFLALRVLQYIASNDCEHFDSVRHALLRQTYVDDICTGADSIAELLQLQSDLIGVLKKSGLELKKWASNTPSVLEAVPMDDRVSVPLPFESVEGYGTRILGLEWHPEGDFFSCALSLSPSPVFSKRGILSLVARIFDPLGVFGPSVFLAKPYMADLPDTRVQQRRPFERVGVDYAGPLQMRELSLRKSRVVKIYVSVFVCFCTKAVHLEVVTDLSTDAFLAAFDRFIARRGLPSDVFSDCGTNFIGADRQLRMLLESPEGQAAIANTRAACVWHFNPPSAPHFGGLWEAAVRSTKRLLVRVIGTHIFTYEEFSTVLARVEAILNSRPLTPASSDPHDLDCLTPGHFLIGQPLLAIPPRSNPESSIKLTQRWKLMDQCHQAFWRRWSAEYLTTLQERSKWTEGVPNLKVNDMVIVVDNQSPPLMWRLGRVLELLPGTDGHVRVVRVMTRLGIVTRPVVKLVPLPAN
ncbi:hypothetical protein QTP88_018370 [Uroleucon formosanum]